MNSNGGKTWIAGILAVICLRIFVLPGEPVAAVHAVASAPAKETHAAAPARTVEGEALWSALLAGNQRFQSGTPKEREFTQRRVELAKGQHPGVIILTCSDSRVPPELIFDQSLGDIFVVRTAGNVCDKIALGSIEYAVEHLHSRLLVVMGHEKCGAVAAAASGKQMPSANLDAIVRAVNPSIQGLANEAEKSGLKGIAANARGSAHEVLDHSEILREMVHKNELEIISAVYHLDTGAVERLDN